MTDQNIIFKNSKTGKVEQILASEIDLVNFQKFIGSWGLRVFLKNGTLHRYGGFKDGVSFTHCCYENGSLVFVTKHCMFYSYGFYIN